MSAVVNLTSEVVTYFRVLDSSVGPFGTERWSNSEKPTHSIGLEGLHRSTGHTEHRCRSEELSS